MFIPLWSILTLFDAKTPVLALVGEICLGQSGGLSVKGEVGYPQLRQIFYAKKLPPITKVLE